MFLVVGLGNPGPAYADNRHNIGFMAVDEIVHRHGFSPWREKFHGKIAEGHVGSNKVLALKPQTYMNESGRSVLAAAAFYKILPEDIFVFHDEIDLAPGKLRVKRGGGHAGHNGLRSIHAGMRKPVTGIYGRIAVPTGTPNRPPTMNGSTRRHKMACQMAGSVCTWAMMEQVTTSGEATIGGTT